MQPIEYLKYRWLFLGSHLPAPDARGSRILQGGDVMGITKFLHLVIPVTGQCGWTYHKRWEGNHVCSTCGLLCVCVCMRVHVLCVLCVCVCV